MSEEPAARASANDNHRPRPTSRVLTGDCRETLRMLPDESVHCCVTSPPYFGLRDYGHDGQIGLEETPEAYIAKMVEVFREVRRVLRDDGTLWLNIGDSYSRGNRSTRDTSSANKGNVGAVQPHRARGCKEKDLMGIPWMLAFALRADGWYLRQDIIWAKPNPMPESVRDRCTKSHEYLFLLSKSPRYYFDAEAIAEPATTANAPGRGGKNAFRGQGANRESGNGPANRDGRDLRDVGVGITRNRRDVWTVATRPFNGAHFATFPPDLVKPCILAGCPVGGLVLDPFGGSGTTAGVALALGRNAVLCELNPKNEAMMERRIAAIAKRYAKARPRMPANDNNGDHQLAIPGIA